MRPQTPWRPSHPPHHLVWLGERVMSQWPDLKEAYAQFEKVKEGNVNKTKTDARKTLLNRCVEKLEQLEPVLEEVFDSVKNTIKRLRKELSEFRSP